MIMMAQKLVRRMQPTAAKAYVLLAAVIVVSVGWYPDLAVATAMFVVQGLIQVALLVIPGILLAAWIVASGAGDRIASVFQGRTMHAVVGATIVGAFVPVCGVTVLPLMAGLLAAGVPLAPVMAFWLASPVTSVALLSATAATLGWDFALGKSLAAIGLGLMGGAVTQLFAARPWSVSPLRTNRIVGAIGSAGGGCDTSDGPETSFDARIWRAPSRRRRFCRECWSVSRLILIVLTPAFAAEFLLNNWLQPDALTAYVGRDSAWAIPLAVLIGGPAYIDGYAALPLTRLLLAHGMSHGAAMAFLVTGGVASIWGAMAIFPVLKLKPFLLYLALAAAGSMGAGWLFGAFC